MPALAAAHFRPVGRGAQRGKETDRSHPLKSTMPARRENIQAWWPIVSERPIGDGAEREGRSPSCSRGKGALPTTQPKVGRARPSGVIGKPPPHDESTVELMNRKSPASPAIL